MLACLTVSALLWTDRYEYAACETDGCVVINRWTGRIDFRPSDYEEEEEIVPEGHVVSRGTARPQRET